MFSIACAGKYTRGALPYAVDVDIQPGFLQSRGDRVAWIAPHIPLEPTNKHESNDTESEPFTHNWSDDMLRWSNF
jgi:hypothetical protein